MKILVIINNHLTNIFIYAFYLQNIKKYSKYKFEFLIDKDIYLKNNTSIDEKLINKFVKQFRNKIIVKSIKINTNYNKFSLKNFFNCILNLKQNKKVIFENKSKLINFTEKTYNEIWVGNSNIIDYFNSNNVINRFEHGIAEFYTFRNKKNLIKFYKIKIENYLNKKLLSIQLNIKSILRTIFQLNKVYNYHSVKQIKKKFLIKSLKFFSLKEKFTVNNVLILYPFDEILKNNRKKIHKTYAEYCIENLKKNKVYKSINTIYVKAKYSDQRNVKNFIMYLQKKSKIKIKLLNAKNYKNIEYYLIKMRPVAILSKINLGIYLFMYIIKYKFIYINTDNIFYRLSLTEHLSKKTYKILDNWKKANDLIKKLFFSHNNKKYNLLKKYENL